MDKSVEVRFYKKIKKTKTCWEWIGATDPNGYGQLAVNGKTTGAHRISWEIHYGKIPKGVWVLHKCDNQKCVRPKHLFLGNGKANTRDAIKKGRGVWKSNIKLSKKDVEFIRGKYSHRSQKFNQKGLAERFNVCQATISNILHRKCRTELFP